MILHSGQAKHKIRGQVGTAAWEFILIITGVTEGKILTDAAKDLLKKMEDQEIRRTWEKSVKKAAANFDQHVCWFNHEKNRPSIFGIDHILGDYLDALAVQQTQIDGKMVLEWTLSETIQKLPFHGHCNRCGEEQPIWRDCSFCETMYRAGYVETAISNAYNCTIDSFRTPEIYGSPHEADMYCYICKRCRIIEPQWRALRT
ncbi:hypothetical protein QAD02_006085 [Eretmocerus hayati]|uniref:Uncharacterized protein n=1 Tax=Eretmocerus hayati TaxID=131215 RepID=A0ACC2N0E2_9HYME|nr:hypothetical protein QAD02_006085 [Eretmocerus hayati]